MFTATGRLAMWQGCIRRCTPIAVMRPPRPWGPMPRSLTASRSSPSSVASSGSGWGRPSSRSRAFLARRRGPLEVAADTHADDDGGAGVGAGLRHRLHHPGLDAGPTFGRLEHEEAAHVFAAAALGHHHQFQAVAGDDFRVDHRRGVIAGVLPRQGVAEGLAQIPLAIALADSFLDGLVEVPAQQLHVLAQFHEDHGQAAILAQGNALLQGDAGVLEQLPEDLPAAGRLFFLGIPGQGGQQVRAQLVVGGNGRLFYRLGNQAHVKLSHGGPVMVQVRGRRADPVAVCFPKDQGGVEKD